MGRKKNVKHEKCPVRDYIFAVFKSHLIYSVRNKIWVEKKCETRKMSRQGLHLDYDQIPIKTFC